MFKRFITLFSLGAFLASCVQSPAVAQSSQPVQWRYSFDANGVATATYPGNVAVQGVSNAPQTTTGTNPTLDGGFIGIAPDGSGAKTNNIGTFTYNGTRTAAVIGNTVQISDGQTGPASSAGVSTANSASYGQSIVNIRPNWNTSGIVGEADGQSIFIRQASGDSAGTLYNVVGRFGFFAAVESFTGSANSAGTILKSINTQLGVVNSRDGGEYGLVVQAASGTNLSAGLRVSTISGSSWSNYIEAVDASSATVFNVRGADGAVLTKTVAPITNLGGDLGGSTTRYANGYVRFLNLDAVNFASLPTCNAGNKGIIAFITDSSVAVTTFNQTISAGGGANTAFVTCTGTAWKAISG